jgi:Protein of unknown function (DUF1059)
MILSLNCKDAGDPICTHTVYGETEKELIENARKHGTETHGYTEEDWQKEIASNFEHFKTHKDLIDAIYRHHNNSKTTIATV